MVILPSQEIATCPIDNSGRGMFDISSSTSIARRPMTIVHQQPAIISTTTPCYDDDDDKNNKINTRTTGFIQIASFDPKRRCKTTSVLPKSEDDDEVEEVVEEEEPVKLVPQNVVLQSVGRRGGGGSDTSCSSSIRFKDLVQSYHFRDFDGLDEFMQPLKPKILQRHAPTLRVVHEKFQTILQEIVNDKGFLSSSLVDRSGLGNHGRSDSSSSDSTRNEVAIFATPNVRLKRGTYATFLHSDAVYPTTFHDNVDDDRPQSTRKKTGVSTPRAMLNIWMSLADTPISNFPLCFTECSRQDTIFAENKLFYQQQPRGKEMNDQSTNLNSSLPIPMWYDPTLTWGSFLCFVAGQPESDERVLLHGAVNLSSGDRVNSHDKISDNQQSTTQCHSTTVGETTTPLSEELVVAGPQPRELQPIPIGPHVPRKTNRTILAPRRAKTKKAVRRHHHPGTQQDEPRKSLEMRYVV